MNRNHRHQRRRGLTVIELLVVIGILSALLALTPLIGSALKTADRMQEREALLELGTELAQATEELRDTAGETRMYIVQTLASRQIDRQQAADLIRRLENSDEGLATLLSRMEVIKPVLANGIDRLLLCDAIELTHELSAATRRLATAMKALVLLDVASE